MPFVPLLFVAFSALLENNGPTQDKGQDRYSHPSLCDHFNVGLHRNEVQHSVHNIEASFIEVSHERGHDNANEKLDVLTHLGVEGCVSISGGALYHIELIEIVNNQSENRRALLEVKHREDPGNSTLALGAGQEGDEGMRHDCVHGVVDLQSFP